MKFLFKIFILCFFLYPLEISAAGLSPAYYKIEDNAQQKEEFIREMKAMVDKANNDIKADREFITNFFIKAVPDAFRGLNQSNVGSLIALRNKYGVENLFDRDEFLKRVDIIPISLALSQAAVESGWGKSRFAREANNLFGHWTYSGVGLIPQNRAIGKTHMIRIFSSLQKSVNSYMLNLNTNEAYADFRNKRLDARNKGKNFTGIEATKTMVNYSELKYEYNKMLKEMIEQNNLQIYDK